MRAIARITTPKFLQVVSAPFSICIAVGGGHKQAVSSLVRNILDTLQDLAEEWIVNAADDHPKGI